MVFGSAGAFGLLACVGLGLALAQIHLPTFNLGLDGLDVLSVGPALPKQPATTCAALEEVREAGAQAYAAHTAAQVAAADRHAPLPEAVAPSLLRLDNALAFASPLAPPLLRTQLDATRAAVQHGRVIAATAPTARAYRQQSDTDFHDGGLTFLKSLSLVRHSCGDRLGTSPFDPTPANAG